MASKKRKAKPKAKASAAAPAAAFAVGQPVKVLRGDYGNSRGQVSVVLDHGRAGYLVALYGVRVGGVICFAGDNLEALPVLPKRR